MSTRVLVIGLDACEKDLVIKWARDGVLPTFARLIRTSLWGLTANPPGFFGGTVWPTFTTGASPATHGRYCAFQGVRGTYRHAPFSPSEVGGIPFWSRLSQAGQRVGLIDVPHAAPEPELNGIHLVDWSTHDPFFWPPVSFPASLADQVARRFGTLPRDGCETPAPGSKTTAGGLERFIGQLLGRVQQKGEISRFFLAQEDWDVFMTVFGESHCVGHQLWHLHEPTHPKHDPGLALEVGDPVKRVYTALDAEVGKLIDSVDTSTRVLVLLSHGMRGINHEPGIILDEILGRLEAARYGRSTLQGALFRRFKRAWYGLPTTLRGSPRLRHLQHTLKPVLQAAMLVPNRRYRRFFAVPADVSTGAIRINRYGREPAGLVAPGAEYRALVEQLRRDLMDITDPTGAPLVEAVHVTAELFSGPLLDNLPDLLLEFNWDRSEVGSSRIGTLKVPTIIGRSGDHQNAGMFLSWGGNTRPGLLERHVPVMDFAPTLGALLDVRMDGVEGRAISEIVGGPGMADASDGLNRSPTPPQDRLGGM